ncbi:alpha/beta hydrolase [Streptomyces sp. NPDC088846]|uniref:alpha/beta hydrolase n=1 Tax=unclassified Streptomyces TaxID=2593676 RepID=UPI00340863A4
MRRYARTLVAVALATTVMAGTAGWASGNAQQALTGPPPGTAAWRADHVLGRELPDPERTTPAEVNRFFRGLTAAQQQTLVVRHPFVVGNLDGVPVELRYRANARSLRATHDPRYTHLTEAGAEARPGAGARPGTEAEAGGRDLGRDRGSAAAGDRQILAFDPRGRGQVAEVFGDLSTARHVAVVVPGSDIDAGTFDRTSDVYGTPAGMAKALHAKTGRGSAVVAWAGYTTPVGVGVDAATGSLAAAGADRLTRFADGLAADGVPAPAVFCHSYGSVVCGLAAHRLRATDLVVLGSPGMRADTVADLHTTARVWAAKDTTDWIDNVPNLEVAGIGHGPDPTGPGFGARRVPAHDAHGHTGYFAPGTDSLRAFASIARGEAR